jgi:hypothetical protein
MRARIGQIYRGGDLFAVLKNRFAFQLLCRLAKGSWGGIAASILARAVSERDHFAKGSNGSFYQTL